MSEQTQDKTEEKQTILKWAMQHGPVIYVILVFVGFLKLHAYYQQFSIDVWTYLSMSELLLSFLPLSLGVMAWITLVVTAVVLNTFMSMTIVPHKHHHHPRGTDAHQKGRAYKPYTQSRAWKRFRISLRRRKFMAAFGWLLQMAFYVALFLFMFGGLFVMGVILNGTQLRWLSSGALVGFIPIWLLSFFGLIMNWMDESEVKPIAIAAGILLVTATTYQLSVNRAIDVLDHPLKTTATITTTTQTITTDSTLIYVGKLQNAVFLYDKHSGVGTAIPMTEVERIDLKALQMGTFDIPDPKVIVDSMINDVGSAWTDVRNRVIPLDSASVSDSIR